MAEEVKATTLARIYREDMPKLKMAQALVMQEVGKTINQEDVLRMLLDDFLKERDSKSKATTPHTLEVPS